MRAKKKRRISGVFVIWNKKRIACAPHFFARMAGSYRTLTDSRSRFSR